MARTSPEDLIREVATADKARRRSHGHPSVRFIPGQRIWIEPIFNLMGRAWGLLVFFMPGTLRRRYVQKVIRAMGGHPPDPNPQMRDKISRLIELANTLRQKTGQWPALLIATSHPETEGTWQWLRFEVMAQGVAMADAFAEARAPGQWFYAHPRIVLAIDPFALDSVNVVVGGIYAGWMHQMNLAYDRQGATQSWIQKHWLLRNSGYAHVAWRFLRHLRSNTPLLMAYGGGLPYNARLLYGTREFVHRLKCASWKVSKREAQLELLNILLKPEGSDWFATTGILSPLKRKEVAAALQKWGIPDHDVEPCLAEFEEEVKLTVPRRQRLLKILYSRLVMRGKPLIILPISHSNDDPHIRIGDAISLEANNRDFGPIYRHLANIFDPSSSKG